MGIERDRTGLEDISNPDVGMSRRDMQVLRRVVADGIFVQLQPEQQKAVVASLLTTLRNTKSERVRIAAIRAYVSMQEHNVKVFMAMAATSTQLTDFVDSTAEAVIDAKDSDAPPMISERPTDDDLEEWKRRNLGAK